MGQAPFSFEEVETEVRKVIIAQASTLACLGPSSSDVVQTFLGIDADTQGGLSLDVTAPLNPASQKIDLKRHRLWFLAAEAYNYAFQIGGCVEPTEDVYYEITHALPNGYAQTDMYGNISPISDQADGPLKTTFKTFIARWGLSYPSTSSGLSVRDLILLTGMSMAAVRNSLSKEGFKLQPVRDGKGDDDRAAVLSIEEARVWLSRRRGFVPTRRAEKHDQSSIISELLNDQDIPFALALQRACAIAGMELILREVGRTAPDGWIQDLLQGKSVPILVEHIRHLAFYLEQPEAAFAARVVRDLIEREQVEAGHI